MESLMRVITTAHANTWHMVVVVMAMDPTAASTQLSFHAAMKSVSVREVSYKHRGFLLPAKEFLRLPHHLPHYHPPTCLRRARYEYFLMLYIKYASRPIYQSLTIISFSSSFIHYLSPPGALSWRLLPYRPPVRLQQHHPHHHPRSTQVNNRP